MQIITHTAIREDASMNLEAVDEMMERFPDIELLFIESGGDNLSATFSPELVDATIFVIDAGLSGADNDILPHSLKLRSSQRLPFTVSNHII